MHTKEEIFFDLRRDMRTSYGEALFQGGVVTGENANLLYGPYISLPAGQWTVTVSGHVVPSGRCYVDAAARVGRLVLGAAEWSDGPCIFQIECPFPVDDFEVRVYASNGSLVRVDGVSVERQFNPRKSRSFSIWERMDLSLLLDPSSVVDRFIIKSGTWEQKNIDFMIENAYKYGVYKHDMVFLDIGSYFGLYSMLMARTNLFRKIVAFEADTLNFRQLCANLLINDPNCLIEPQFIAISEHAGEAVFESSLWHPEGNRGGVGINEEGRPEQEDKAVVKTEKIDHLIPMQGERVFVKIDVEGHELKVLAGMLQTLSKNKVFLQVETFFQLEDVCTILEPLGYVLVHEIKPDYFFTNFETA